jgi:hypothetical protein
MNNNKIYTYSIVDFPEDGKLFGTYKSSTPKKAAEKAFIDLSIIVKDQIDFNKDNSGKFIVFVMINNQTKEEIKYLGTRIKLDDRLKKYKYKNVIGLYKDELDLIK